MDPGDGCDTMLALGLGFHQHYDQIRVHKSPSPVNDQKGGDDDPLQLPSLTLGLLETAACESASEIFHTGGFEIRESYQYQSTASQISIDHAGLADRFDLVESGTRNHHLITQDRSSYSNCLAADQGDLQEAGDSEKRPLLMISDENEDCITPRKKLRLSKEQISILETSFMSHSTLNPKQKEGLARQICLSPRQVEVWFQNRRARIKLKQTEVDCQLLRRRCEALREENRKLQEELHELKSQTPTTTIQTFLMQIPQNALPVMCPSCERITDKPAAEGRFFSRNFRIDQQLAS